MVENLLIIKNTNFDNEDSVHQETNTPPLNTDDDESMSVDGSQQPSENIANTSKSDIVSENLQPEKIKRRKRPPQDPTNENESKKRASKKRPWYSKIDLVKPIVFVTTLLLAYFIWINRDVLIVRLLTSNARVRHMTIIREHNLHADADSSQGSSSKESPSISSSSSSAAAAAAAAAASPSSSPSSLLSTSSSEADEDEIIGGNNDNVNDNSNDNVNHDQGSSTDNDDDSPKVTSKHSGSSQKINLRTRRNKMSFSKDRPKTKHHRLRYSIVDDDNVNDDVGDDDEDHGDDNDDDNDDIQGDKNDKITNGSNKIKEPILPSDIHTSKKHHHHRRRRSVMSHEENQNVLGNSKPNNILPVNEDIIEQLRKIVKSQGGHRDLTKTLSKATGLNEAKINRFIHDKDYSVITLDTFISLLNSFDSKLLILSK